jgi:hypothetical protein
VAKYDLYHIDNHDDDNSTTGGNTRICRADYQPGVADVQQDAEKLRSVSTLEPSVAATTMGACSYILLVDQSMGSVG